MTLVRTQELLDTAVNSRVGVAAFNVITLEHAAITAGAEAAAAPAILQVSQNAVKFHGGAVRPLAAALQEIARATSVDLALHLDHVEDIRLLHQAADSGFSSVMFDASMLGYAANIAATDEAARWAHRRGLLGSFLSADGRSGPEQLQTGRSSGCHVKTPAHRAL